MSHGYDEPPALDRWQAEFPSPATAQYAGLVRRFLQRGRIVDLRAVQLSDLVAHVQALRGKDIQKKTASALSKFFAYLARSGDIPTDPARDLRATLKEETTKLRTHLELLAAGMSGEDAGRLTWRDIARALLGTGRSTVPLERMPSLETEVMARLASTLFVRMKSCTLDGLENLLDRSIDA